MLTQENIFNAVAKILDAKGGRFLGEDDWAAIDAQMIYEEGGEDEGYTMTSETAADFEAAGYSIEKTGDVFKAERGSIELWGTRLDDGRTLVLRP